MAEHAGEKSFEATPHRRQEAREKGQVAFSQDLGSAALLMLGVLAADDVGRRRRRRSARSSCSTNWATCRARHRARRRCCTNGSASRCGSAIVLLPILGLMMLGGVLASVLQVGFLWVPDRLAPDISRLSPLAGLQRIFSLTGTMRLGFGLVKVLVVSVVAVAVLWRRWDEVLRASGLDIPQLGQIPGRYFARHGAVGRRWRC